MALIETHGAIDMTTWTLAGLELDSEYNLFGWTVSTPSEHQISLVNIPPSVEFVFTGTFTGWDGTYDIPDTATIEAVERYSVWKEHFLGFSLTGIKFTLAQLKTTSLSELLANTPVTLLGSNYADIATGSTYHDYLLMNGGDDVAEAGAGDDIVYGGGGRDNLDGKSGQDSISGGGGRDHLSGGIGNDYIIGNRGDDFITGGEGSDSYTCGPRMGNDTVVDGFRIVADYDNLYFPVMDEFESWSDFLENHVSVVGDDVMIRIDADNSVVIKGLNIKDVTTENFWLHFESELQ